MVSMKKDFNITTVDEDGKAAGQVEIIGRLYQYYNTEPKNKAFAKKAKITKEEIPKSYPTFYSGLDCTIHG